MERFSRQPSTPAPAASAPSSSSSHNAGGGKGWLDKPTMASKILVFTLIGAGLAILLAISASAWGKFSAKSLVKENQYQAIFLDNGQVYFGKLSSVNSGMVRLTDIFYLQVEQQIQPDQDSADGSSEDASPQISLAKLGNELHGPEDEMFINRDKIVFWENLKDDGQVVQAINNFKAGGGQANTEQQNNNAAGTEETQNIEAESN